MSASVIIFCTLVLLATASVILLAIFSPAYHEKNQPRPRVALAYIQQPQATVPHMPPVAPPNSGAFIFHRTLTEGPENTSRVVGKVQGFIIPVESFAHSAYNVIYLTFHTRNYTGSVSIQAKNLADKEKEEMHVLGGTESFAFARGHAVFAQTKGQPSKFEATHRIKLHLEFPIRSQAIPG